MEAETGYEIYLQGLGIYAKANMARNIMILDRNRYGSSGETTKFKKG